MRYYILLSLLSAVILAACKSASPHHAGAPSQWYNIAVAEGVEIYVDTANINHDGAVAYATEKRVFVTPESKAGYVDKIRTQYEKMGKPDKAKKWDDFSYCIYHSLYECTNKRFRILSVEDYDSSGKLIIRTTSPAKGFQWLNIERETVGDYTFFYVCDYGAK